MATGQLLSRDEAWNIGSLWRLLLYDFVLASAHFRANMSVVYTYGSALETNSPRFNSPGVFLTYVIFVATVILVSLRVTSLLSI